jgi:hypothetical protein
LVCKGHTAARPATNGDHSGSQCTCTVSQMAACGNHMGSHAHGSACRAHIFLALPLEADVIPTSGSHASGDPEVPFWRSCLQRHRSPKFHLQKMKVLVQRTGMGCHWCRTLLDVWHHLAGPLGLQLLGAILQPLPASLHRASMGWKPRLASHRALMHSGKAPQP